MKKLICAVAALGLAAGVATTASALDFSVSGQYTIEGYYLDSAEGAGFNPYDDDAGSDSAWIHTFMLKPTLKVNDKITMKADIRFLKDTDFGTAGASNLGIKSNPNEVDIDKIYMEYMSPIGKMRFGRTAGGAWQGAYLNTPANKDRIYLFPKMPKPWGSYVFYQKVTENDWLTDDNDDDYDLYEASIYYTTKEAKYAVGYDFFNDKTAGDAATPFDRQRHRVKGYVKQIMGDVWVEAEVSYDFGDYQDFDVSGMQDIDLDTLAGMVAVGTSFDNLKVHALYFYASGDDDLTDDDVENAFDSNAASDGVGDGFNPYYILTGDHTGMLNSDEYADDLNMATAGVHCLGVSADLAVSDKLTLHGALAYAMAADEDGVKKANGMSSLDDEYGWEIDLGAKYKLLDNLTYEARAGYFATGDFFDDLAKTMGTDDEDLLLLSHHLTMTF